jgi:hypothetical protein
MSLTRTEWPPLPQFRTFARVTATAFLCCSALPCRAGFWLRVSCRPHFGYHRAFRMGCIFAERAIPGYCPAILCTRTPGATISKDPLVSHRYGLTGKQTPSFRRKNGLFRWSSKSAKGPRSGPSEAHIAQLTAYCVLVSLRGQARWSRWAAPAVVPSSAHRVTGNSALL